MKWILFFSILAFLICFIFSVETLRHKRSRDGFNAFTLSQEERYDLYIKTESAKPPQNFLFISSNVSKNLVSSFYFAANISAIAYYTTYQSIASALAMMGGILKGYVFNASCQAFIAHIGTKQILAIRGTEFTEEHHNIWEVWDDLNSDPKTVKPTGAYVHSGFYDDLFNLWPSILKFLDINNPVWIIGHSLGGVRAHLARSLIPHTTPVRITTFGGPRGANFQFWDANMKYNTIVERVVAERDFAPDFPWMLPYFQPTEGFYWLTQGTINYVTERDYLNLSLADHRLTSSYIPLLEKAMR